MGENHNSATRLDSETATTPGAQEMIVIGDSLAEGRGDPGEHGGFAGWASQLARRIGVPDDAVVNLGRHRATTAEIADKQLPLPKGGRCRLVAIACGTNDVFSDGDLSLTALNLDMIISEAVVTAPTVVCTLPEVSRRLPLATSVQGQLSARFREVNDILRRVSRTYGAGCLDLWQLAEVTDDTLWCADRIHPSPHGHGLIADGFAKLLEQDAYFESATSALARI